MFHHVVCILIPWSPMTLSIFFASCCCRLKRVVNHTSFLLDVGGTLSGLESQMLFSVSLSDVAGAPLVKCYVLELALSGQSISSVEWVSLLRVSDLSALETQTLLFPAKLIHWSQAFFDLVWSLFLLLSKLHLLTSNHLLVWDLMLHWSKTLSHWTVDCKAQYKPFLTNTTIPIA